MLPVTTVITSPPALVPKTSTSAPPTKTSSPAELSVTLAMINLPDGEKNEPAVIGNDVVPDHRKCWFFL
jgi:hypothetical protein